MVNTQKISTEDIVKTLDVENSQKSFLRRYWWQLLIIIIILMIGVYYYFKEQNKLTVNNYETVQILKKDLIVTVSATGNIEPTNTVDIGIEVSGTIEEVLVDYNDKVIKNQTLAKLDTTKLLSKVNNSKASLEVAKANLMESEVSIKDTKNEFDRLNKLYKFTNGNYPTKKEIDQAKISYEKAKAIYNAMNAKVSQAKASLKSDEDDLKKAVVVSPIDGVVLDKKVDVGQSVVASMQIPILFTLAQNLTKMQVVVSVDEADVGNVKENQRVTFSVDTYPSKTFEGKITQVRMNSQIVNGVVTYETLVEIDNSQMLLRPGMTVSADIVTKVIKDNFLIPNSAFRFSPDTKNETTSRKYVFSPHVKDDDKQENQKTYIWILKDGKAVQVAVEVGESDGIYSVLTSNNIDQSSEIIVGLKEK